MASTDELAGEEMLVIADLDGKRSDARIRLAAAITQDDVEVAHASQITEHETLQWDTIRNDLVARAERRLDALDLSIVERPPTPGARTTAALLRHIHNTDMAILGWDDTADLIARLRLAHTIDPDTWPDLTHATLLSSLDEWLGPFLTDATGRRHLESLDLHTALWHRVGFHRQGELDDLLPTHLELAGHRPRLIDYGRERPTVRVRVQHVFGVTQHPTVGRGQIPLVIELLSPADRPIQVTADLPGFWSGSWADVRKDMAGRYPKHDWPVNPVST